MPNDKSSKMSSFFQNMDNPHLSELYIYWQKKRANNSSIPRRDFDPMDIPKLLPNLILSDVSNDGLNVTYRLVGTEITEAYGLDFTGRNIEDLTSGETLSYARNLYQPVIRDSMPVFSEGHFQWPKRQYNWTKRLHLPMSKTGEKIDMVLCYQAFEMKQHDNEQIIVTTPKDVSFDQQCLLDLNQ